MHWHWLHTYLLLLYAIQIQHNYIFIHIHLYSKGIRQWQWICNIFGSNGTKLNHSRVSRPLVKSSQHPHFFTQQSYANSKRKWKMSFCYFFSGQNSNSLVFRIQSLFVNFTVLIATISLFRYIKIVKYFIWCSLHTFETDLFCMGDGWVLVPSSHM